MRIGCHLSSSKGYLEMGKTAKAIGANTFQFFTRNPRGGSVKPFDEADAAAFVRFAEDNDIKSILAHAPYTMNACSADAGLREFAYEMMTDDIGRLEYFGNVCYNFHPGSHVKQGADVGIELIAEMLNKVIKPEQKTVILLETMSGKGSEVGRRFEELKSIIDRVELNERIGVCMDTCHVFDSGYDIVSRLDEVVSEFDRIVGLDRLKAIHLNDTKNVLGSHKDRHEKIGEGNLGIEAITRIINHPALRELPFYLETPNELDGYAAEIRLLRGLYEG